MAELPPVSPGDIIASDHINDIAARSAQRYASEAERDTLNPTPVGGELAFVVTSESFGSSQLFVFVAGSGAWHVVVRGDQTGNINLDGRYFITSEPGEFRGLGAIKRIWKRTFQEEIVPGSGSPQTDTLFVDGTFVYGTGPFERTSKMIITMYGALSNQHSYRVVYAYHDVTTTGLSMRRTPMNEMTTTGTGTWEVVVTEYY